jgi:hypothetical protein
LIEFFRKARSVFIKNASVFTAFSYKNFLYEKAIKTGIYAVRAFYGGKRDIFI